MKNVHLIRTSILLFWFILTVPLFAETPSELHIQAVASSDNTVAADTSVLFQESKPDIKGSTLVELPNFASLVQFAQKAVVNIASEASGKEDKNEEGEDADKPSLEDLPPFFRRGPQRPHRSLGSGFFINSEGYIVTNHHVVQDADSIIVRIPEDKHEYAASLVGGDEKTDLALIKIEPLRPVVSLPLGDSDALQVGEWVLAVGNQFQLGQTFTAGIVSAKARKVPSRKSGAYDQFIQTDASINPGSSGGPLINAYGQVVGINTAIFSPGRQQFGSGAGFNIGIGFSVPVNLAKGVLVQLKKSGRVTRGLLGVIIQSVTIDIQNVLNLPEASGALVADVLEDTPAYEAGFEIEDVITHFAGKKVDDHDDLPLMVANTPVGEQVSVTVLRNGRTVDLKPTIGELKDRPKKTKDLSFEPDAIGLIVEEITSRYSRSLGQDVPHGVVISQVTPGSPAEQAGLMRGDVIEELDRRPIRKVADYERVVKTFTDNQVVLLLVRRKEGTRFLTLKVDKTG